MKGKSTGLFKVVGTLAIVAACTVGIYTGKAAYAEEGTDRLIAENIYVGEVHIGGMTEAEAVDAVDKYVESLLDTKFTLGVGEEQVVATARDFGVTWNNQVVVEDALGVGKTGNLIERYKSKKDLEHENLVYDITYTADETKIKNFIAQATEGMNQEAVNYGLTRENGAFVMTDGQNGVAVDVDGSTSIVKNYIENDWSMNDATLELAVEIVEPKGTKEQLSRVRDLLGTFTTDFHTSGAGRAQNVRNAASKINGSVIYPGDQFSVYEVINPFSPENGYELAGSYENGTTVQSYGGGVCQVSTTLYNAVIRAELAIDERFCHSMIVSYVKPSMDAAISGTYKDLKFTNNYDFPIYIEGYTSGMTLTFNVYGEENRPAGREVIFESQTTSTSNPEPKIVASADHPIGYVNVEQSAHVGYTAKLWKIVKENGVEVSREQFNSSTYNPSPRIVTVGTASEDKEAAAAIKAAIETKDEEAIRAAAAANSAEALEKKKKEEEKKKQEEEEKKQQEEEAAEEEEPEPEEEIPEDLPEEE